jgi:hypothetical protein
MLKVIAYRQSSVRRKYPDFVYEVLLGEHETTRVRIRNPFALGWWRHLGALLFDRYYATIRSAMLRQHLALVTLQRSRIEWITRPAFDPEDIARAFTDEVEPLRW